MWLIYAVGGLVIAHIWKLHSQRDSLRKALGENKAQLEECQQELENIRSDDEDDVDGRMNPA